VTENRKLIFVYSIVFSVGAQGFNYVTRTP